MKDCSICNQVLPEEAFRRKDQTQCIRCLNQREIIRYVFKRENKDWVESERKRGREKIRRYRANPKIKEMERKRDLERKSRLWRESPEYRAERNAYRRNRYNTNPSFKAFVLNSNISRRHKDRDGGASLTPLEWYLIQSLQNHKCARCQIPFTGTIKPTRDHIVSIKEGGILTFNNTQALCRPCNSIKGKKSINYLAKAI